MGVSTTPDATALKRIESLAYSSARHRVIASRPPLVIIGTELLTPAMGCRADPLGRTRHNHGLRLPAVLVASGHFNTLLVACLSNNVRDCCEEHIPKFSVLSRAVPS